MAQLDFDKIRSQIDIVQVINTYLPLKRQGKGYVGVCPFHNDTNPSMQVSQEKQIYKCFSCGASGNVFTFIKDYEKISFIEAVKKACDIAGIKVEGLEKNVVHKKEDSYQTRLIQLMKDLTTFYSYQLKVAGSEEANNYLAKRNLDSDVCSHFKIGYSPVDGHASTKFLLSKNYTLDEIISSGVGVEVGNGEVVDRLRGRLIFPLADQYGQVIGYSGRRLKDSDSEQKYVNTPETVLFHKSSVLYNYNNAINNAKREGACYIVEGFMDTIALYKAGIKGTVATMGTAFTSEHINLLKSLNCELRLLFDSDNAGLKATNRTLDMLKDSRLKVSIVRPLEGGKDIDEILNSKGKENVIASINLTWSNMDFRLFYLGHKYNLENHEDAKKYVEEACTFLSGNNIDEFDKEHYISLISSNAGFSKELVRRSINDSSADVDYRLDRVINNPRIKSARQSKNLNKFEQAEHQIIQLLLDNEMDIIKFDQMGIVLYSKICRDIAALIVEQYYKKNKVELADLYNDMTPEMNIAINEILNEKYPPENIDKLASIVMKDYANKKEEKEITEQLLEENDAKKQAEIAEKIIAKRRSNKRINKEVGK